MKINETHTTTITVEPGDKVRDLAAALDKLPNGADISVYAPFTPGAIEFFNPDPVSPYVGLITVDHRSIGNPEG
ncbi:hypothetical protein SEA_NIKLAS_59 [Mycobacterium Phage Niklas]|uniref:Uncharacterized protein n=1 Tax=Mycobacterium Phage Niklas TaxID=2517936 RepID=A0A482JHY0_9CAUD|nr:hypothetical protein I5H04_gp44 [Mycobacterium Phage Niklas]ASR85943.1 hypothetical protein SEA_PEANAM_59 [Mycobacterium phage Peanam]QAY02790.1 hypothetical protein SEA_SHAOBING_59 [Mycobacterium phage Shaobing]QBP31641.1 hypothetical protein SEA_NIKLAS_59 [Mycobacterium Phage Niklas]